MNIFYLNSVRIIDLQICVHSSSYFVYYLYCVDICERVVKDLYLTNHLQQHVEIGFVDMRVIKSSFTAKIKRCLEKLELIHIVALIMPLFFPSFFLLLFPTITIGLSLRPSLSLARLKHILIHNF